MLSALAIALAHPAQARGVRKEPSHRPIHDASYRPPYADIVIDDKSGAVLHESNADDLRHPASLTKVMTLYLLFEQLEAGNLRLDTPLPVSAHAAAMTPTKLGLKPKQIITVEDALKGLVTRSANDAAVVIAEAIGGSEEEFAKRMTHKAALLGMASTTYVNASGLPAEAQLTTARDQATLGRAIQHRFPNYYGYFALPSFRYRGAEIPNHNALLTMVKGVDGIKTGYTEASGYNLLSSIRRDGKHMVAAVLGGSSSAMRNARMRDLLEGNVARASTARTEPVVAEASCEDPAQSKVATPAILTAGAPLLAAAATAPVSLAKEPRQRAKSHRRAAAALPIGRAVAAP